ncbi:hypothetical protein EBS02_09170 [bacterium]|nr:hypothetical protein [bacterium]
MNIFYEYIFGTSKTNIVFDSFQRDYNQRNILDKKDKQNIQHMMMYLARTLFGCKTTSSSDKILSSIQKLDSSRKTKLFHFWCYATYWSGLKVQEDYLSRQKKKTSSSFLGSDTKLEYLDTIKYTTSESIKILQRLKV